jgi:dolichol-phosphate mannosyltransferase
MSDYIFLSIVMPAYNEEANIEAVLEEHLAVLRGLPPSVTECEIVCLDDCSRDRTPFIIERISRSDSRVRLVRHTENKGIYQSFADLYHEARGTYIYATGSDGQWPARNLLTMLSVLPRGVDLVVGERPNRRSVYNLRRQIVSHAFNLLPLILFGVATRDAGSIKLGRKELFVLPLRSRSPFVEAERIIVARRNGYQIAFVPIEFAARSGGKALGATFPNLVASLRDCLKLAVTSERYPSRRTFPAPQCPKT